MPRSCFLGFVVPLFVPILVSGCSRPEAAAQTKSPSATAPTTTTTAEPLAVTVTKPKATTLNWSVEQPATVQAFETTPIHAKLPAYVEKVHVDIGDVVKAGQLLAELAIPELALEAEQKKSLVIVADAEKLQAEKSVEVAKSQLTSAEAMVGVAKAGVTRAKADQERWDSELRRVDSLATRQVIDQQTRDEIRHQAIAAKSGVDEANAKIVSAEQFVKEASAKLERAAADITAADAKRTVAVAEANRVAALLDYTKIKAPFNGLVTARTVHTGHFLQPMSGNRSEPMFVVSRQDTIRVFADVPENASEKAKAGTPVLVRFPALGQKDVSATITRTAKMIAPETRSLRIEVDLPNADGAIVPGQYAMVRLMVSTPNAWIVPSAAVLFADETVYAYAVDRGKVSKLRLQLGKQDGTSYEVLRWRPATANAAAWQTFTGGETLVVGNLGALADGQNVVAK
jgi:HlyD family secretion protein